MILNRLLNADGATVGYFTDDEAGRATMQAARVEWDAHGATGALVLAQRAGRAVVCRSVATPIKPLELEDVEPDDGDQVDYVRCGSNEHVFDAGEVYDSRSLIGLYASAWLGRGAASVEVQRHEINRYRRPGKSNRSADLGGPEQAAGVLYILTIKAPK
jgi:hypothetical protein